MTSKITRKQFLASAAGPAARLQPRRMSQIKARSGRIEPTSPESRPGLSRPSMSCLPEPRKKDVDAREDGVPAA